MLLHIFFNLLGLLYIMMSIFVFLDSVFLLNFFIIFFNILNWLILNKLSSYSIFPIKKLYYISSRCPYRIIILHLYIF